MLLIMKRFKILVLVAYHLQICSAMINLIQDLLNGSNEEIATDLAQTLLLNQGFEDLTKKSLLARFIKLYPSIQKSLLSAEATVTAEEHS